MLDIKQLRNYQSAFSLVKVGLIISIASNILMGLGCMYWVIDTKNKAQKSIWVLSPSKQVYHAELNYDIQSPDRIYEYQNHLKLFYSLFFSYDENNYQQHIEDALYLIDDSGQELYQLYQDNRLYDQVLQNNLIVQAQVDSISINMDQLPREGVVYARQFIKNTAHSAGQTAIQNMHATFLLQDVARSIKNPHGVKLDKFTIFNNERIQ
ncbi:MAG: hypothetical protein MI674_01550 [Cytophagales bacterium]|nr:hypothetical protein [Cytophagales bacterium]